MAWILGLVALYLLLMFVVAWISIHPPRIPIFISPGSLGTPQEEVVIGSRLRGWWVEGSGPNVAVFAHGYMMNRAEMVPTAFFLWQRGYSCLLFDFRAHGSSPDKKSTVGLCERDDVKDAVAFARERKSQCKIVIVGSSMGSAAAALAMGDNPSLADALVLDSCYCRLSSAILGWWRFVGGRWLMILFYPVSFLSIPVAGFNPFKVDISMALTKLKDVPVLMLHGDHDTLALPSEAQRNYSACPGPKRLVWFPGCGHSEGRWIQPELYNRELLEFLSEFLVA